MRRFQPMAGIRVGLIISHYDNGSPGREPSVLIYKNFEERPVGSPCFILRFGHFEIRSNCDRGPVCTLHANSFEFTF